MCKSSASRALSPTPQPLPENNQLASAATDTTCTVIRLALAVPAGALRGSSLVGDARVLRVELHKVRAVGCHVDVPVDERRLPHAQCQLLLHLIAPPTKAEPRGARHCHPAPGHH